MNTENNVEPHPAETLGSEFYVWHIPGKPLSIHIGFDVIRRIQQDARNIEEASQGLFGFLLGRSIRAVQTIIIIEDYDIIPSTDTASAPSRHEALENVLTTWPCHSNECVPVGFFRTHRAGWISLNESDLEIFTKYFKHPDNVALLIRAGVPQSTAAFFFWEGENVQSRSAYHEFPFDVDLLKVALAKPGAYRSPTDISLSSPRAPRLRIAFRRRWTIVAIVLLGVMISGAAAFISFRTGFLAGSENSVFSRRRPASPPSTTTSLGLKVRHAEEDLEISWDQQAVGIMTAERGTVAIIDGLYRKIIALGHEQLRQGRVIYTPVTNDISIRLEAISGDGDSVAESVQMASGRPLTIPSPIIGATPPGILPLDRAKVSSERPEAAPLPRASDGAVRSDRTKLPPAKAFVPPAGQRQTVRTDLDAGTPPLIVSPLLTGGSMPTQLQAVPPVPPVRQPTGLSVDPGALVSRESAQSKTVSNFVPPQVLRRVSPVTTHELNNLLAQTSKTKTVEVHAMLDDKGKVIKLDLAQESRSMSPLLTSAALAAARQWVFSPASLGGKNVPSTFVVSFVFQKARSN